MAAKRHENGKSHQFGGDWTTDKLSVLAAYLQAYTTALRDKPSSATPFKKAYIDAFAGSGYRQPSKEDPGQMSMFADLPGGTPDALLDGSARLALKTDPPFDTYIFVERNAARCSALERLGEDFPDLADRIKVRHGEANDEIQAICAKDWNAHRAVLFLDPYGMQVEWKTIEAVANTRAIDLWILFPLGIGVNRLLTRSGDIPEAWRRRLTLLLGTEDWYEAFYRIERTTSLFGDDTEHLTKATTATIGQYFNDRLRTVFPAVAEQPRILKNAANSPLYLLCFAAGNSKGAPIAVRIANHLLTKGTA